MKTIMLYREKSEQARPVEAFLRDYQKATGLPVEKVELDSKEGAKLVELYGPVNYPVILVIAGDGQLHQMWEGMILPRIQEVEHATRA